MLSLGGSRVHSSYIASMSIDDMLPAQQTSQLRQLEFQTEIVRLEDLATPGAFDYCFLSPRWCFSAASLVKVSMFPATHQRRNLDYLRSSLRRLFYKSTRLMSFIINFLPHLLLKVPFAEVASIFLPFSSSKFSTNTYSALQHSSCHFNRHCRPMTVHHGVAHRDSGSQTARCFRERC
jgi:hypothetical protein